MSMNLQNSGLDHKKFLGKQAIEQKTQMEERSIARLDSATLSQRIREAACSGLHQCS